MTFTYEQKLQAIKRELHYRRRVYRDAVAAGNMTQALSDKQIAVMEAIRADYELWAKKERLL